MKAHFTHRIGSDKLVLEEEENTGNFVVSYLSLEVSPDDIESPDAEPEMVYYSNHSQEFKDYNEALECFRGRVASKNPLRAFVPLSEENLLDVNNVRGRSR